MSKVIRNKLAFQCPRCDTVYGAPAFADQADDPKPGASMHVCDTICPMCFPRSPFRGVRMARKYQPRHIRSLYTHQEYGPPRSAPAHEDMYFWETDHLRDGSADFYDKMADELSYEAQCDLHSLGALDMDGWY